MPIYEYGCRASKAWPQLLQKMSDDPLVDCPQCGQPTLKRLISAPRFRLKGDGWYETDFKTDNQRNLAKGDNDSGAKSGKTTSDKKKGDGKSAANSSTKKSSDSGKSAAAK